MLYLLQVSCHISVEDIGSMFTSLYINISVQPLLSALLYPQGLVSFSIASEKQEENTLILQTDLLLSIWIIFSKFLTQTYRTNFEPWIKANSSSNINWNIGPFPKVSKIYVQIFSFSSDRISIKVINLATARNKTNYPLFFRQILLMESSSLSLAPR